LAGGPVALFLVLCVGGVVLFLAVRSGSTRLGKPAVTQADLDTVQPGMSSAEVRNLLGRPTKEVDSGALSGILGPPPGQSGGQAFPSLRIMLWTDNSTYSATVFFENDKVMAKFWNDGPPDGSGMPPGASGWGGTGMSDASKERTDQPMRRKR
jgi:hypothetical protein